MRLTAQLARSFAHTALDNVTREYPAKPDHVLGSDSDMRPPREWHPAFYGSFDWHSCVHMHWLLARVRRLHPANVEVARIDALFDRHLTAQNIAAECAYLARPESMAFERTYGWAWLLELANELERSHEAQRWSAALHPLAHAIVTRYLDYLPRQRYPLRHGLHANSAFGLAFAFDYARMRGDVEVERACTDAAIRWFHGDRDMPMRWEPSGADILSPSLMEADLMRRVLPRDDFAVWLDAFLPALAATMPAPAIVDDRSDPYLVHLDGLNLSRAWCMQGIAHALPPHDTRIAPLRDAAQRHIDAGLSGLASGDYVGAHWLATFATLALTAELGC